MNKSITLKLFALLVMSSLVTLSFNNAQATTWHQVSIDGNIGDFDADEFMDEDAGVHHNFTYMEPTGNANDGIQWQFHPLSLDQTDAGGADLAIYWAINETDETNGCNYTSSWNGVVHQLPFFARWAYSVEDSTYDQLEECVSNAAGWAGRSDTVSAHMGYNANPVTEFKIPYNDIGADQYAGGANISYLAYAKWQTQNNVYASWPTQNPANQSGAETFTHFYKMPIENNYSPLMAPTCPDECGVDPDPPATPGYGNATEEESTLAETIGVVVQVAVVVIMVRVVMDMVRKLR